MGFYNFQDNSQKEQYGKLLNIMGSLSNLFSNSENPYMDSRIAENVFCRCFEAENLARFDCTADAKKNKLGIGIKTWVGGNRQKIAEFNKLKREYDGLSDEALVHTISTYRNDRINFTLNAHNLSEMIYHCSVREKGKILIKECPLETIDVNKISVIDSKANTINFTDGINLYGFNKSKSVLYKKFDNMEIVKALDVEIIKDPFKLLEAVFDMKNVSTEKAREEQNHDKIYLRLYTYKSGKDKYNNEKYVPSKSGLNQWNAGGRKRNPDEIYIPVYKEDKYKNADFFPSKDVKFNLTLPDGKQLSAKICQAGDKALMSDPNKALGKWLLRDVLKLKEGTLVDYALFEKLGIDSVVIEKVDSKNYKINFAKIGSYEEYMSIENDLS